MLEYAQCAHECAHCFLPNLYHDSIVFRLCVFIQTTEDIAAFAKTYRGSADEREDVLDAYQTNKGDMNAVMGAVPCCTQVRIACNLKADFST